MARRHILPCLLGIGLLAAARAESVPAAAARAEPIPASVFSVGVKSSSIRVETIPAASATSFHVMLPAAIQDSPAHSEDGGAKPSLPSFLAPMAVLAGLAICGLILLRVWSVMKIVDAEKNPKPWSWRETTRQCRRFLWERRPVLAGKQTEGH